MYLVDTNIWLERLLDQERSAEVAQFLTLVPTDRLCMSDFSLHSVGVILHRLGRASVLLEFIADVFGEGGVSLVSVAPEAFDRLVAVAQEYGLDFDDAYQYVAAETVDAEIVSFDADFVRTRRGRLLPGEIPKSNDALS
jgi:uncharacterized protein